MKGATWRCATTQKPCDRQPCALWLPALACIPPWVAKAALLTCRSDVCTARTACGQKQTFDIHPNLELSSLTVVLRVAACQPLLGGRP